MFRNSSCRKSTRQPQVFVLVLQRQEKHQPQLTRIRSTHNVEIVFINDGRYDLSLKMLFVRPFMC